jgi:hypothetical protein
MYGDNGAAARGTGHAEKAKGVGAGGRTGRRKRGGRQRVACDGRRGVGWRHDKGHGARTASARKTEKNEEGTKDNRYERSPPHTTARRTPHAHNVPVHRPTPPAAALAHRQSDTPIRRGHINITGILTYSPRAPRSRPAALQAEKRCSFCAAKFIF